MDKYSKNRAAEFTVVIDLKDDQSGDEINNALNTILQRSFPNHFYVTHTDTYLKG
jgi:hypothetical protein